jgi:hypothetical protein
MTPFQRAWGSCRDANRPEYMLTTHLQVAPRLRLRTAVILLPMCAFVALSGNTLSFYSSSRIVLRSKKARK